MIVAGRAGVIKRKRPPIESQDDAAVRIQSAWRGKQERKSVMQRKSKQRLDGVGSTTSGSGDALLTDEPAHAWLDPQLKEEEPSTLVGDPPPPIPDKTPEEMLHELRTKLYDILENPESSNLAQVVSVVILGTIIFSIACFILETMPKFRKVKNIEQTWRDLEVFCTLVFTVEYVVRLSVCGIGGVTICQFVRTPSNVFDILAILPFYLQAIMNLASDGDGGSNAAGLRVLRAVRLIRLVRIFKLGRYSSGMQLMAEAVRNSFQALWVLCFFLAIGVVLFSSALYYTERLSCPTSKDLTPDQSALYQQECRDSSDGWDKTLGNLCCDEHDSPLDFPSILEAFWWAIVTMTTVGFGEIAPKTTQGKIVGTVTMLSGILLIALPVAIVGRKFQEVYDDSIAKTVSSRDQRATEMLSRRFKGMRSQEIQAPYTPLTGIGSRLRTLRLEDPGLIKAVGELSDLFEESEKMHETIHRLKVAEVYRQQEVHSRFSKVLSSFTDTLRE